MCLLRETPMLRKGRRALSMRQKDHSFLYQSYNLFKYISFSYIYIYRDVFNRHLINVSHFNLKLTGWWSPLKLFFSVCTYLSCFMWSWHLLYTVEPLWHLKHINTVAANHTKIHRRAMTYNHRLFSEHLSAKMQRYGQKTIIEAVLFSVSKSGCELTTGWQPCVW